MLKTGCPYCGRLVARNQHSPASNHVYKHIRRLRQTLALLLKAKDSDLLAAYSELRSASSKVAQARAKRSRIMARLAERKTMAQC